MTSQSQVWALTAQYASELLVTTTSQSRVRAFVVTRYPLQLLVVYSLCCFVT